MYSILIITLSRAIYNSLKELLEYEKYSVLGVKELGEAMVIAKSQNISLIIIQTKYHGDEHYISPTVFRNEGIDIPIIYILDKPATFDHKEAEVTNIHQSIGRPIDIASLLKTINEAVAQYTTTNKPISGPIEEPSSTESSPIESFIGCNPKIEHIKQMIRIVAPSDARILITGENGTGKEVVAKVIHKLSSRRNKPLIEVNCAAIPQELIESELFGHEKGSFTSALKLRKGKFEQAHGGTLFLDEIGDMGLAAQSKVLRVLQEKKITRVGGDEDIFIDVRVLAATNKDLRDEIKNGRFREDLYHRLSVVEINVPSLNDRITDIPLLVAHFIKEVCKYYCIPQKNIDPDAIEMLQNKNWSGNVRELHNVVERLVIFSKENITADMIDVYVNNKYS